MNLIDFKTQSNDLSKIFIPKCYEIYINNAINSSHTLLTITEFINNTGFEVDVDTFDILFMNINDDENPIYITSKLLDWMGYSGLEKFRKNSSKIGSDILSNYIEHKNIYSDTSSFGIVTYKIDLKRVLSASVV